MSEKKYKKPQKKCKIKCGTCEFYDAPFDYCTQNGIEDCSKKPRSNFSQCKDYLVREDLVMFYGDAYEFRQYAECETN